MLFFFILFRIFFFFLFFLVIFFVDAISSTNSSITRFGNEKKGKRQIAHAHIRTTPGAAVATIGATAEAASETSELIQSQQQIPIYGHQTPDQYARRAIKQQNVGEDQERQQQQPNEVKLNRQKKREKKYIKHEKQIHFYFHLKFFFFFCYYNIGTKL